MAVRKKKLTHPLPKAGHSRGYLQNLRPFYFTSSPPPPLCAIKETGIQTPIRWFIGDTSLPYSRSASFPNKVIFLASTPRLWFIGLSGVEQSELGLNSISTPDTISSNCLISFNIKSMVKSSQVPFIMFLNPGAEIIFVCLFVCLFWLEKKDMTSSLVLKPFLWKMVSTFGIPVWVEVMEGRNLEAKVLEMIQVGKTNVDQIFTN